jgi:hypothetical protein
MLVQAGKIPSKVPEIKERGLTKLEKKLQVSHLRQLQPQAQFGCCHLEAGWADLESGTDLPLLPQAARKAFYRRLGLGDGSRPVSPGTIQRMLAQMERRQVCSATCKQLAACCSGQQQHGAQHTAG